MPRRLATSNATSAAFSLSLWATLALINASNKLLLTGATGFLGGAIAASLISSRRWRSVLLLVRAGNPREGRDRVLEVLARFGVPRRLWNHLSPVQIVCGDLCETSGFRSDRRLREVSDVINAAALATFANHSDLWRINVEGTLEFARVMSAVATLRRFVHVGTGISCGVQAPSPVAEGYEPGEDVQHLVRYAESKLEGERRLRRDLPSLPLVVVRPSTIVGHTQLGCKPSPSIFWVFRVGRALRAFTCAGEDRVDVVPVDYCAKAILQLLDKPELKHDMYHVSAGAQWSCTFAEIDAAIAAALGTPPTDDYKQVDYETLAAKQDHFEELFGPCIRFVMLRAIKLYGEFARLNMLFDNRRLMAEGVPPPPRFTQYAGLCAATSENATIAEQMGYDFKGLITLRRSSVLPSKGRHKEARRFNLP